MSLYESTITQDQAASIRDWLAKHPLSVGVGSVESACSIAAINLALSGQLTDEIPPCMSSVIGKWLIAAQDAMPSAIRNSQEYLDLLPLAAGTGRDHEFERLEIIMNWLWGTVLPSLQPIGEQWATMCRDRTEEAARSAGSAAEAAAWSATAWSAAERWAAAGSAAEAAGSAAEAAVSAAAGSAAEAAGSAAEAAVSAAAAAGSEAERSAAWHTFDPVGLLRRLVFLQQKGE